MDNARKYWQYLIWSLEGLAAISIAVVPLVFTDAFARGKVSPYFPYWPPPFNLANWPVLIMVLSLVVLVFAQRVNHYFLTGDTRHVVGEKAFIAKYAAVMKASMQAAFIAHAMTPEQRTEAQRNVLKAIKDVVHFYYDQKDNLEINSCLMKAYPAKVVESDLGILRRLRFKERMRPLGTYDCVLDLVLWAEDSGDLPKELALPVEDPYDDDMKLRLLPGAPAAHALGKIFTVEDTNHLEEYFETDGRNVDAVVKREQMEYFRNHGFRSFASIPLELGNEKVGVLNVQSNHPHIFGPNNEHRQVVRDLLVPFCHALSLLLP